MLGPVFTADLRSNSRRPRLIVLRTLMVVLLLLFLWLAYQSLADLGVRSPQLPLLRAGSALTTITATAPATQLADFGGKVCFFFILIQFVFLMLVGPAYVANAIAEEKQRGTLEYLLASELTSLEIVVGKYCSRLLLLLHFVLICVPVLTLTLLIGGVSMELILGLLLGTIGCAMSLTALALWVSVMSRKGRDALIRTYMIVMAVIIASALLTSHSLPSFLGLQRGETLTQVIEGAETVLRGLNPLQHAADLRRDMLAGTIIEGDALSTFGICFAGHAFLALCFVLLTAVLLRRRFLRQYDQQAKRAKWVRAHQKPAIGWSDPLFWKERHVDDGSWRLFGWFAHLFRGYSVFTRRLVLATLMAIVFVTLAVFLVDQFAAGHRQSWWLTWVSVAIFAFAMLAAAVRTASSIAVEKDRQTWDALLASPLPTSRLLSSRLYGGFLSARWLFFLSIAALHLFLLESPRVLFTVFMLSVASVAYLWFTITLAGYFSLNSPSSIRNVLTTLTVLIMLNAFPLLVLATFGSNSRGMEELFFAASHPATSLAVLGAGLIAIACVVAYYKVPRARWLIGIVKWIGYLVLLNVALFSLLAGLTFSFSGLVGMRELSLLVSPLGVYSWTVFEHLPARYYFGSRSPDGMVIGSGLAYLAIGGLLWVLGQYKLRKVCGRIDHAGMKHGKSASPPRLPSRDRQGAVARPVLSSRR